MSFSDGTTRRGGRGSRSSNGGGNCCAKFTEMFVKPTLKRVLMVAYGLVMSGLAMAALLDRETATATFGGFRWMLMTALIYEFVLAVWCFIDAAIDDWQKNKLYGAYFHLLVSILYVFPFAMFQITWYENKYQADANWRSLWGIALSFVMMGSYVPEMIRALVDSCPDCSPSGQGFNQVST